MQVALCGWFGAFVGGALGGAVAGIPGALTGANAGGMLGLKLGAAQQGANVVEDVVRGGADNVGRWGERVVNRGLETADIWEKLLMGGATVSATIWGGIEMFKTLANRCVPLVWTDAGPCVSLSAGSMVLVCVGTWYGCRITQLAARRFFTRAQAEAPNVQIPPPIRTIAPPPVQERDQKIQQIGRENLRRTPTRTESNTLWENVTIGVTWYWRIIPNLLAGRRQEDWKDIKEQREFARALESQGHLSSEDVQRMIDSHRAHQS